MVGLLHPAESPSASLRGIVESSFVHLVEGPDIGPIQIKDCGILSACLLMVLTVSGQTFFCNLTVIKQYVNDLLVPRVTVLEEHHSVQASVPVLALCIHICSDFDELSDCFDIFMDDCKVEWSPLLLVIEIESHAKVSRCYLSDTFHVIGASCLQDDLLLWT